MWPAFRGGGLVASTTSSLRFAVADRELKALNREREYSRQTLMAAIILRRQQQIVLQVLVSYLEATARHIRWRAKRGNTGNERTAKDVDSARGVGLVSEDNNSTTLYCGVSDKGFINSNISEFWLVLVKHCCCSELVKSCKYSCHVLN